MAGSTRNLSLAKNSAVCIIRKFYEDKGEELLRCVVMRHHKRGA